EYPVNDTLLTVAQIRSPRPSPDGKRLVFTALDRLWVMDFPSGKPKRLTTADVGEHSPAWSPDGRWISYVTWTERGGEGGAVWRIATDGISKAERLTTQPGYYDRLAYTPDGRRLIVSRGSRQPRIAEESPPMDLMWLPADGDALTRIMPVGRIGT